MVTFDCGHGACLSCVTSSLSVLRQSSSDTASGRPTQAPIMRPLPCYFGPGSCDGVLFCAQTRAVLRRIQPRPRPAPAAPAASITEPLDLAEAAVPPHTPSTPDSDAAAANADTPPPAAALDAPALDEEGVR
jgi:hypothetical protein